MELGFRANAGPLTQITLQLFSMETAVHLAIGAYGWWKSRDQAQSLAAILEARNASLAPISTFNLQVYAKLRNKHPMFGVARQLGARMTSVEMPFASSSQYGTPGQCCLYALVTALLCFFDEDRTLSIVAEVLPDHLVQYDQEDVKLSKGPGPLYSALRLYIRAVAKEEQNSKAIQTLLRGIDNLGSQRSLGSLQDIYTLAEIGMHEVLGLLTWLALPYSKRTDRMDYTYPTRSFCVWALADTLSSLGFGIHVSKTPILTKEAYASITKNARSAQELSVHFVPVAVGMTDPYIVPTSRSKRMFVITEHIPRVVPIRIIPYIEFRYRIQDDEALREMVGQAWRTTFDYIFTNLDSLRHQKPLKQYVNVRHINVFGEPLLYGSDHLYTLISGPLLRYLRGTCLEHTDLPGCWESSDAAHNAARSATNRLMTDVISLATAYAIACQFLEVDGGMAGLDTEIAYRSTKPGMTKIPEHAQWIRWMFREGLELVTEPFASVYGGSIRQMEPLIRNLASAVCGADVHDDRTGSRYWVGCHANGITLFSKYIMDPANPSLLGKFSMHFGQPLDLPVRGKLITGDSYITQDPFICRMKPESSTVDDVSDGLIRWDLEPNWLNDELDVHYQCRHQGLPLQSMPLNKFKAIDGITTLGQCQIEEHQQPAQQKADQALRVYRLPVKSIRMEGHLWIQFEDDDDDDDDEAVGSPNVIVVHPPDDPVELYLALSIGSTNYGYGPVPFARVISPCERCGLQHIQSLGFTGTISVLIVTRLLPETLRHAQTRPDTSTCRVEGSG